MRFPRAFKAMRTVAGGAVLNTKAELYGNVEHTREATFHGVVDRRRGCRWGAGAACGGGSPPADPHPAKRRAKVAGAWGRLSSGSFPQPHLHAALCCAARFLLQPWRIHYSILDNYFQ